MSNQGKIAIIGAGHVGSHCAMSLAAGAVSREIVLMTGMSRKPWLRFSTFRTLYRFHLRLPRSGPGRIRTAPTPISWSLPSASRDCPDSRLDLLGNSVRMLRELLALLKPLDPGGIVITITNPADIVADFVRRELALPRSRAFGTGALLDTARLVAFCRNKRASAGRTSGPCPWASTAIVR